MTAERLSSFYCFFIGERKSPYIQAIIVYVKDDVQKLCFIPMLNNKFNFKFNVFITLSDKSELQRNIGLCIDGDTCNITNWDLQNLNNQVYENETYVKNDGINYSSRYKEYVNTLKDEYIDNYQGYIEKYENGDYDANRIIRAINNYI